MTVMPVIRVFDDMRALGAAAAEPFARAIAADPTAVIGVATRSSPSPVYAALGPRNWRPGT
ncbi:hypothetical protein [Microbacterium sulfonylureivorans]|uniref:hypothetical protein n=1 Tax=Microbacterium sulfonylureivorans TaxID=2486854 RepID=UPI001F0CD94B|nr:hypothetical protein [Microbacterium sulfonylureivorans]